MTLGLGLTISAIGVIIVVATFYIGRMTAAKSSGQEWGEFTAGIKSDLTYIKDDVKEIKDDMKAAEKRYNEMNKEVGVMQRDLKTAFSKIDDLKGK